MTALIGHDEPWRVWRAAREGVRMHHGWILAGREGLGKARFARAAAADYVATTGVAQPAPEVHPDITLLEPLPATDDDAKRQAEGKPFATKRNISVDQIRQMQRRLTTRPTLGSRRAIVIDAADALEKSAVNALLKSLEEPPEGTVFLLVVHRLGRLLPTVRSRCRILRFHPLEPADLARAVDLALPSLDASTRSAALTFAGGSPGAAISFAEQGMAAVHVLFNRLVDDGDPGFALRSELAGALGQRPAREKQLAAIEAARAVLTARLQTADDAMRLRIADAHAEMVRLAAQAPTYNFDPALVALFAPLVPQLLEIRARWSD